eukprot:gene17278-20607_t
MILNKDIWWYGMLGQNDFFHSVVERGNMTYTMVEYQIKYTNKTLTSSTATAPSVRLNWVFLQQNSFKNLFFKAKYNSRILWAISSN